MGRKGIEKGDNRSERKKWRRSRNSVASAESSVINETIWHESETNGHNRNGIEKRSSYVTRRRA